MPGVERERRAGHGQDLLIHKSVDSSEQQARIAPVPRQTEGSLASLLNWLTENLHEPLDLQRIADRAHLSTRTLARHFRAQMGTTPIEWILRQRVESAQSLLEHTNLTVLQVARSAGFSTAETMRRAFNRRLGISPRDYRIAIRDHCWAACTQRRTGTWSSAICTRSAIPRSKNGYSVH
ncbi:hypothetical protein GCM10010464_21800 [Pseudonocardia yunnanensis]|uniref:Helix-turn-helix domain-containing protein n=1 Tax=Pseudonocardia yunnanensis TaxID=58107 RepID=A0ABW4ERK5_9PSEU